MSTKSAGSPEPFISRSAMPMLRCVPKLRFLRATTSPRQSQMWWRRTFSSSKPPPVISAKLPTSPFHFISYLAPTFHFNQMQDQDLSRNDDAQKHFHIAGERPRQLPEFEFLYNTRKFDTRALKFEKKIATIADQEIFNDMPVKTVETLLETAKASLVGKNEQTVLDETARKSHEILAAQIQLEPSFQELVSQEIARMAEKLSHPNKVIARLYKLVIYKEGDFFKTHIDSPHKNTEPMVFTASVQLPVENSWRTRGGRLQIAGETIDDIDDTQGIQLTLFYHDVPHAVELMQLGYRVSLIFDVVDSGERNPNVNLFDEAVVGKGFAKAREKGFESVAIMASHSYFGMQPDQLKGADKMFHDLALAHGAKRVEVCEVFQEGDSMLREEVLNIMKVNKAFSALYFEPYDKKKENKKEAVDEAEPNKFKRAMNSFDDEKYVSPVYEEKGEFRDLPDKYRLGVPCFWPLMPSRSWFSRAEMKPFWAMRDSTRTSLPTWQLLPTSRKSSFFAARPLLFAVPRPCTFYKYVGCFPPFSFR